MGASDPQPLAGRTIVTTRDLPGLLDRMLAELGAIVLHAPLITVEPLDVGAEEVSMLLGAATDPCPAWLIVTSQHAATAAGELARIHHHVRLAAVGRRTAEVFTEHAGRPVDVVPARQTAADLVAAMPAGEGATAVVLQGDLAAPTLTEGLAGAGYLVVARTAYRTLTQHVDPHVRAVLLEADAVTFASGSAARAWAAAIGPATPPVVAVIGPTAEAVATEAGIVVTHVAATHDLDGLTAAVVDALAEPV